MAPTYKGWESNVAYYGVRVVRDDEMPVDREWMFVIRTDGSLVLWLARSSAGSARVLSEAWAAFRAIECAHVPQQRQSTTLPGSVNAEAS